MSTPAGHRSLADQLRSWPAERITALLLARPDLASPPPQDSGQLAARAATRSSLVRALDGLNRCELAVLDALAATGPTTPEQLQAIVHADPDAVTIALAALETRALAWRATGGVRVLTGVAEALAGGPGSTGLRPVSDDSRPVEEIVAAIEEVSAPARAMLTHVDDHGGEATSSTARTIVTADQAGNPAEELIARRLLVPRGGRTLVLPGEVAIALRGGRTTRERVDRCPELPTSERDQARIDHGGAGAAFELVRRVEQLLDGWSADPPAALRSGGLAVRDLAATAGRLHLDQAATALLIETVAAAGLLGTAADPDGTPRWIPTDSYDDWLHGSPAQRWTALARVWSAMPRQPALVGQRDPTGKTRNALIPELTSPTMPESRRMTLAALASIPVGHGLATGTGGAAVLARLTWERPRRTRSRADQVGATLTEAPVLGVVVDGGLPTYARALLAGDDPLPLLEDLLPTPVDHVLLQADLTAVAPGPLEAGLARRLQGVADTESSGGATVYRFTPGSVRRAMDLGWTAVELHEFISTLSRTPVPQPLTYLIDDTARRFGSIRVGYAGAYVRAEDEHALSELLAHPDAAPLGLRRLAPTVVVSSTPLDVLLPRLRELGAAPAVEDADGVVHLAAPDARRARTPRDAVEPRPGRDRARERARTGAVVNTIRTGDRAYADRPAAPAEDPPSTMALLREAIDAGDPVLLAYVDSRGTVTDHVVVPARIEDGRLTAHARGEEDPREFALARIRSVRRPG